MAENLKILPEWRFVAKSGHTAPKPYFKNGILKRMRQYASNPEVNRLFFTFFRLFRVPFNMFRIGFRWIRGRKFNFWWSRSWRRSRPGRR